MSSSERRGKRAERREKREDSRQTPEDRPEEAARGPQMKPLEGDQGYHGWHCVLGERRGAVRFDLTSVVDPRDVRRDPQRPLRNISDVKRKHETRTRQGRREERREMREDRDERRDTGGERREKIHESRQKREEWREN